VCSTATHPHDAVSSLSAQFVGRRRSARGSTSSKLLPPPSDQRPHCPPSQYRTSSTSTYTRLVTHWPASLVATRSSGMSKRMDSPRSERLPEKLPKQLVAVSHG